MDDKFQRLRINAIRGLDRTEYDFGLVQPGEVLKFEFNHTNEGGVFIQKVTPGCGCTAPSVVTKNKIAGTFTIPRKEAFPQNKESAEYKKNMTVYFDDGSNLPIHITQNGVYELNPEKVAEIVTLKAIVNLS